jgi:hypothetical protein
MIIGHDALKKIESYNSLERYLTDQKRLNNCNFTVCSKSNATRIFKDNLN